MKTCITGLLKRRIARWGFLTAILIAVGTTVGWMNQRHYQLGRAFIGSGGGLIWNALQIPLDPAGRTAAIRIKTFTYGADFAGLLAAFGADTTTEDVGEGEMISRDTQKFTTVGYGTQQGNPPLIRLISVMTGTGKFTGPDSFVVNYTLNYYPAAADADGNGYPDPGTTPLLSIPGTGVAKRVPILK